jgi:TP901 family phage tail tape measure protein
MSIVSSLEVVVGANITGMTSGLNKADSQVKGFGSKVGGTLQSVGGQFTGLGAKVTGLSLPLAAFGISGIQAASSFESSMAEISARTGLVGEDLTAISDYALQMGADTSFSAQEAADAFLQLTSSGQSAEEAIATLPAVLSLAAASGSDLGETADAITDIMAQFGLSIGTTVPENFKTLQTQMGISDDQFTAFGNDSEDAAKALAPLALALGVSTDELYDIWNASKQLTPEISKMADELGITATDWDNYIGYLDGTKSAAEGVTPEIKKLIDTTGLSGERLAEMFSPENFNAAADVADILAQAAGASSASIEDLTAGFGNVGGVAAAFGLDVSTTAAILAIFAENGTKGAEAGTALKSLLTNFNSDTAQAAFKDLGVSMYDADGNMRDFETVIGDLDTALDALPIEEQNGYMLDLAGSYGITGLTALRGATSIGDMEAAMDDAADASTVAAAKTNTFAGRADALAGSVETLQINALTPFMDNVLTPLVEQLTTVVNSVSEWAKENPELASTIVAVGAGIVILGPALIGLGIGISAVGTGIAGLTTAFTLLSGPLLPVILLFAGVAAGIVIIKDLVESGAMAAGIQGWATAFESAGILLEITIDRIKTGLTRFALDAELVLQTFIGKLRQNILSATGIDIAPNFNVDTDGLRMAIAKTEIGDMVYEQLQAQIASGEPIDLGKDQTFTVMVGDAPVNIQGSLATALLDPAIIADMGVQGRMLVESALTTAFTISDQQTVDLLTPVAVAMGIDLAGLEADVKADIAAGNYDTAVTANITVTSLVSGLQHIPGLISQAIAAAGGLLGDLGAAAAPYADTSGGGGEMDGFAEGTDYVDKTGVALIHEGERILTKEQNRAITGIMASGSTPGRGITGGGGSGGGGNVYNINSYGESPRALIDLIKRELAAEGL